MIVNWVLGFCEVLKSWYLFKFSTLNLVFYNYKKKWCWGCVSANGGLWQVVRVTWRSSTSCLALHQGFQVNGFGVRPEDLHWRWALWFWWHSWCRAMADRAIALHIPRRKMLPYKQSGNGVISPNTSYTKGLYSGAWPLAFWFYSRDPEIMKLLLIPWGQETAANIVCLHSVLFTLTSWLAGKCECAPKLTWAAAVYLSEGALLPSSPFQAPLRNKGI